MHAICTTEEPSAAEEPVENVQGDTWLDEDIQQLKDFGEIDVLQVDTATQLYDSDYDVQLNDAVQFDDAVQLDKAVQLDDAVQLDNAIQVDDAVQLDDEDSRFYNAAQFDDDQLDDPVQFDGNKQFDETIFESQEECHEGTEDSDEDDDSEPRYDHDDPLYPGAEITVGIVMTLLLAFAVRHKLTNEADLLYLINHICPKPNRCCKTLYKFKKFFSFLVLPFKCCYYCSHCFNPISVNPISINPITSVTRACSVCSTAIKSVKDLSYFIHISISD